MSLGVSDTFINKNFSKKKQLNFFSILFPIPHVIKDFREGEGGEDFPKNFQIFVVHYEADLSRNPQHCYLSLIFLAALDSTDK